MARGLNSVQLIGNVGSDVELRYTRSGAAVATIRMATTDVWFDKVENEKQERTEWHRVIAWGKLAEIAGEYVKKGRQLYVQGRIQTRKWEDSDGHKNYTTEIIAKEILMLGPKEEKSTDLAGEIFGDPQSIDPLVTEEEIPF